MPDLSIDCPFCGGANVLPVESEADTFTCTSCGETAPIDQAVETGREKTPDYLVGEIISDCKILQKVGEGGFGSVYKATDQNLQRTVALKVMLPSLTTNVEFVQKFLREAVTAAQLNHPNIVAIHKVGKDERRGINYLIMEFVEGRTLADVVKEKGVFTWQECLPLMIQACDALATAHERSIVHRDIKPENLMVDRAGVLKITDFGLAKSLTSDQKTTKVMGTPHYMSPEQFEGKAVDGRSDIYSLGVTFYFLLSKSRPYEGQNTVQIIYSILTQQPRALTDVNKEVPPAVWSVIEKMIGKRPEDRYQTLRDTITDLKKLQAGASDDKASCPQCGVKNPKNRKFCKGCGSPLVVPCPACGSPAPAGTRICGSCGADLERLVQVKKGIEAAKRFHALGDLRQAVDAYRKVLELDPGHAEAKAESGRLSEALEEVQRVSAETDEMMRTGAVEGALTRVEDLLRRFPNAADVKTQRDNLRQALADRKVNRLVDEAEALAAQGKLREAMEAADQALRADPAREDVRAKRAEYGRRVAAAAESRQRAAEALAAGRYEEAFQLASEVLKVLPGDAAMEELLRKAKASVESVDQFLARGQEKLKQNRFQDALGEFEAALSLRPSDARVLEFVRSARGRIAEQRERIANARRLTADRQFPEAIAILKAVLAETPEDLEAKSILTSCERGVHEAARLASIERALAESAALETAGETAKALARLDEVAKLDPDNEVARNRRELIERKFREEKALRELADEHLADGLFEDAVETLSRLRAINPAKAAAYDAEVTAAKRSESQVKSSLDRAEQALAAREFRRAGEAAQLVLDVAPKHPRAAAIRKDSEKAVAAIDRFLGECDQLLASEMFDEAMDALDKAKERGATPEEYKHRKESCEQGRLALLKTDATRSLVVKDFEAAITAYQNVLEVRKDDADALEGKRRAERRLKILTTEPLGLRVGTAAMLVLSLGLLQYSAYAFTKENRVNAIVQENDAQNAARVLGRDRKKLEPEFGPASAAEAKGDWRTAQALFETELRDFPQDPRLLAGRDFAASMVRVERDVQAPDRLRSLANAMRYLGDVAEPRRVRLAAIAGVRDAAVAAEMSAAAAIETSNARSARERYQAIIDDPVGRQAPAVERIARLQDYLDQLEVGQFEEKAEHFASAARSYFAAKTAVAGDATRTRGVDDRLSGLRGRWLTAVHAAEAAAGPDEQRHYDGVSRELAEMSELLSIPREQLLDEYRKGR